MHILNPDVCLFFLYFLCYFLLCSIASFLLFSSLFLSFFHNYNFFPLFADFRLFLLFPAFPLTIYSCDYSAASVLFFHFTSFLYARPPCLTDSLRLVLSPDVHAVSPSTA